VNDISAQVDLLHIMIVITDEFSINHACDGDTAHSFPGTIAL